DPARAQHRANAAVAAPLWSSYSSVGPVLRPCWIAAIAAPTIAAVAASPHGRPGALPDPCGESALRRCRRSCAVFEPATAKHAVQRDAIGLFGQARGDQRLLRAVQRTLGVEVQQEAG